MKSICLLINHEYNFDYLKIVNKYLLESEYKTKIDFEFPKNPLDFDLIVALSYNKIIPEAHLYNNLVVVHSSNLPYGRGWAPIYYAFSEGQKEYFISVIFANSEVDTGNIIAQASFIMQDNYIAPFLRILDFKVTLKLIVQILKKWPNGKMEGSPQIGESSYRVKRKPIDSELKSSLTLEQALPHLRGCEDLHPAYFNFNGCRFLIKITPDPFPEDPKFIRIFFPSLNEELFLDDST